MGEAERLQLIFAAGLSTREADNTVSGRGVGMDAVAAWVRKQGGNIAIDSQPGHGTRVTLRMPLRE